MSIQKIKSGRQTNTTAEQYIGGLGALFYNETIGDIRLGDGVTPGGIPLLLGGNNGGELPIATDAILGGIIVGNNLAVTNNGSLSVDLSAVNQDIIPSQDSTYSLGSAEFKWKDLHVSLGSIYLGDVKLSSANGALTISDTDPYGDLVPDSDPATVLRVVKNVDTYINLSIQNLNPGTTASSDILLYNDLDPATHYADFGIASSNYSDGTILKPNDIYLLGGGGDVKIGTTFPGKDIVFFAGGVNDSNEVARFTNGGLFLDGDILFSNGNIFAGSYTDLSDTPNIFSGNYSDLVGIPNLFAGSYHELTNKPVIPTDISQLHDQYQLLSSNSLTIKAHGSILAANPQSINFEGALRTSSANGVDIMVSLDASVIGFDIDGGYPFSMYGGVSPIDAGTV